LLSVGICPPFWIQNIFDIRSLALPESFIVRFEEGSPVKKLAILSVGLVAVVLILLPACSKGKYAVSKPAPDNSILLWPVPSASAEALMADGGPMPPFPPNPPSQVLA
jgi:hypothetical protein